MCSNCPNCQVCSLVVPELETGPSPSKIIRIEEVVTVSPRDKIDPKKRKSDHPSTAGLVSVKLDFQKGARMPSGEVEFLE